MLEVPEKNPAIADCPNDRGKVVVLHYHCRGLLRYIGPASHRHADVGLLQRGRVIDTVACHRHHMPILLKLPNDPKLVLGGDTCVYIDRIDGLLQGLVAHSLQVCTGDCPHLPAGGDIQLTRDRRRSGCMVTSDHDDLDAGMMGIGNCLPRLVTWRVFNTE